MGDVAMTVPVLKALAFRYPDVRITVVSKPFFKPLFDGIPNLHFMAADVNGVHKGVRGLYKLFVQLKKLDITHVADFHNVLRSKIVRSFFATTPAAIGVIDKGRAEKKELTKESEKSIRPLKSTHERYADVLAHLGFPVTLTPLEKTALPLPKSVKSLLDKNTKLKIGVAPFAAFQGKMYPLDLMKQVLLDLAKMDCQLFLFGGGATEKKALDALIAEIPNAVNMAQKMSFQEELSLISNLNIMVSMDSGNAHLAANYGVDTITIWGVTHPFAGFAPFGQPAVNQVLADREKFPLLPCSIYGNKVFDGYQDVMRSIAPNQIVESVKNLIQKKEL